MNRSDIASWIVLCWSVWSAKLCRNLRFLPCPLPQSFMWSIWACPRGKRDRPASCLHSSRAWVAPERHAPAIDRSIHDVCVVFVCRRCFASSCQSVMYMWTHISQSGILSATTIRALRAQLRHGGECSSVKHACLDRRPNGGAFSHAVALHATGELEVVCSYVYVSRTIL